MSRLKLAIQKQWAVIRFRDLKTRDTWFFSHFVSAANEIGDHLAPYVRLNKARVLDFGCGDGFTALGVLRFGLREVVGVDLNLAYSYLPELSQKYLGTDQLPANLSFQQVLEGEPLPFEENSFDAIYAWSVLEHVQDVHAVMVELHRVLSPDGIFFIQIEPLYHSPFGSHLLRLIPEPWAHLRMTEEAFLERAKHASDQVRAEEKDLAYQSLDFEEFKKFLINEYSHLNQITIDELITTAQKCGFKVIDKENRQRHPYQPDAALLDRYVADDLLTNELRLTLNKAR